MFKQNIIKTPTWIYFLLLTAGLSFALLIFFQHKLNMTALFNADELYFYMMPKSIFVDGVPYHSWYGSTSFYFFPAMFFVLLGGLISHWHVYYALLSVICIRYILFYLGLAYFAMQFIDYKKAISISTAFFFTFFAMYGGYSTLSLVGHFDTLLLTLLLLAAFYAEAKQSRIGYYRLTIIFLLSSLTVMSDGLFTAWFVVPLIFTVVTLRLLSYYDNRKSIRLLIPLISSIIFGKLLLKFFTPHHLSYHTRFSIKYIPKNIHDLIHQFINNPFTINFWIILSFTAALTMIYMSLRICAYKILQKENFRFSESSCQLMPLWLFNSFVFIVLVPALITFNYPAAFRYLDIIFVTAILSLCITLVQKYKQTNLHFITLPVSVIALYLLSYNIFSPICITQVIYASLLLMYL